MLSSSWGAHCRFCIFTLLGIRYMKKGISTEEPRDVLFTDVVAQPRER